MEKNKFSNGGKKVVDCYVRVAQIVGTACRESGGRERKWEICLSNSIVLFHIS
jgi:hypothetical protein